VVLAHPVLIRLLPFKENEMTTKKQLTPEQRAMLNELVNGAFSSIAIHFLGDTWQRASTRWPMQRSAPPM